jgi:hypothetical protein
MARRSTRSSTWEGALSRITRGRASVATRGAAHLVAVEPGLVAVQPHNVVGGERGQLEGLIASRARSTAIPSRRRPTAAHSASWVLSSTKSTRIAVNDAPPVVSAAYQRPMPPRYPPQRTPSRSRRRAEGRPLKETCGDPQLSPDGPIFRNDACQDLDQGHVPTTLSSRNVRLTSIFGDRRPERWSSPGRAEPSGEQAGAGVAPGR